jgi:hypothetical protein
MTINLKMKNRQKMGTRRGGGCRMKHCIYYREKWDICGYEGSPDRDGLVILAKAGYVCPILHILITVFKLPVLIRLTRYVMPLKLLKIASTAVLPYRISGQYFQKG